MKILYNNVDIYDSISVNQCIHDMYAEQRADTLLLRFNDTRHLWDNWKANKEDTIAVELGAGKTGKMFIESVKPEKNLMTLRASSIPPTANNPNNKSWQNVYFSQIVTEIANRHKLTYETYGVTDQLYKYVCQSNKSDFVFLEERCVLEGCTFLVYDGKLVVYSEKFLESQSPKATVEVGSNTTFQYDDNSKNVYGICILKNGSDLVGKYSTGSTSRQLDKTVKVQISNQAEADRYAMNMLRFENKKMQSGVFNANSYLPEYAAGSIANISTQSNKSWDGSVFLTHVRHDYVKAKSKIFFRKVLNY